MNPSEPDPVHPESFTGKMEPEGMNVAQVHGSIMREQADSRDGFETTPAWLLGVFFFIVFWAGLYLAFNSGGFKADVFNPTLVSWTGRGAAPAGPPDPRVVGKRLFTANCVVCHQTTGMGVPGQFPPLAGSEWVVGGDWHGDNHLVKILLNGLQGVVTVNGAQFNNAMPAWQQLKDDHIAAILTYIRSEWGNEAAPITTDFVARIREQTKDRSEPWSQAELKAIEREVISEASAKPATTPQPATTPTESVQATQPPNNP